MLNPTDDKHTSVGNEFLLPGENTNVLDDARSMTMDDMKSTGVKSSMAKGSVFASMAGSVRNVNNVASYIDKHKHGDANRDNSDQSSEDEKNYAMYTPVTKRKRIKEDANEKVEKLGAWATSFTIFKGFVCTGVLYMPLNFVNGGYVFSAIGIILACVWTLYCAKLLIKTYEQLGGGSFPEIGYKCYGRPGKIATDIALFSSQFGFCCAYVYFIGKET